LRWKKGWMANLEIYKIILTNDFLTCNAKVLPPPAI